MKDPEEVFHNLKLQNDDHVKVLNQKVEQIVKSLNEKIDFNEKLKKKIF